MYRDGRSCLPLVRRGSPRARTARAPVVDDATRRQFLTAVAAAGLLTGCGSTGSPAPTPAATRRVTHQFGTFDVPTDPQRVIGLEGRRDLETCLALGISPSAVGSNAVFGDDQLAPFIDFSLDGVTVLQQSEPNLELIASLRPDLILTRDSNVADIRDELVALAPVLPVGGGTDDATNTADDWRADVAQVATWLGREDRLRETLADYDTRRDEVSTRHADRISSAVLALVQFSPEEGGIFTSRTNGFYLQAQTLGELGGIHLPFLENLDQDNYIATLSAERTSELAPADAILMIVNAAEERATLDAQPLWQRLPAVQAGHVVFTESRANYGSVYAATECLRLLDDLYATLS